MTPIRAWDIGGVHIKTACLQLADGQAGGALETRIVPFEIWKTPDLLSARLAEMAGKTPAHHAVTMTAELSDVFAGRAEGVRAILDACAGALPGDLRVLDTHGNLIAPDEARERPHAVAAANWMAPAALVAQVRRDAVLLDVGSTTTDIVPIRDGAVRATGTTDTARLVSGELVYTGVLRTPPAALADVVPLGRGWCRVSPEHFTVMGDVYRVLGEIEEADYTVAAPDGRGAGRAAALARLARLVCGEPADIGGPDLVAIARFLRERQVDRIAGGLAQVLQGFGSRRPPLIAAGAGAFLAPAVAARSACDVVSIETLGARLGDDRWGRAAPAAALAVLLAEKTTGFRFIS